MKASERYSQGLYLQDKSLLEPLEVFLGVWGDAKKFFLSPAIPKEEKKSFLRSLFKTEVLLSFFSLLIESQRISLIPTIIQEYKKRVLEGEGVTEVKVVTAVPPGPETIENLKKVLEKNYNKKVQLEVEVDSKIIGGVILYVGNTLLDYSLNGRLETMRTNLCK